MKRTRHAAHAAAAITLTALAAIAAPARADAGGMSEASELSVLGAASIAAGSLMVVETSATFLVESLETVGRYVHVALRGASEVGRVVVVLSATAVAATALAIGATVVVVAESAGWLLSCDGRVVAFVPNDAGKSLLFSGPARRK